MGADVLVGKRQRGAFPFSDFGSELRDASMFDARTAFRFGSSQTLTISETLSVSEAFPMLRVDPLVAVVEP